MQTNIIIIWHNDAKKTVDLTLFHAGKFTEHRNKKPTTARQLVYTLLADNQDYNYQIIRSEQDAVNSVFGVE